MNDVEYREVIKFYWSVQNVKQKCCCARDCEAMSNCDWYNSPLNEGNYTKVGRYWQIFKDRKREIWCPVLPYKIVRPVREQLKKVNNRK